MASSPKVFSLEGKGLKLDTKEDVEAHIKPLKDMNDVVEVRFLGNTLGVEACKTLGEVLETKKTLQVCSSRTPRPSSLLIRVPDCKPRRYIYRASTK